MANTVIVNIWRDIGYSPETCEKMRNAVSENWGRSPVLEHKQAVEREKNAAMRAVVDAICYPADR